MISYAMLARVLSGFLGYPRTLPAATRVWSGEIIHLKLYYWFLRANWLSLMAYPAEFITVNLAGILYSLGSVCTVWVLFSRIRAIGDWTFPQVLFIYGLSLLSRSLIHLFWADLMSVSWMVRTGRMDRLLVRPLNVLYQVVAGYLDNDDWGELLMATGLIWASLKSLGKARIRNVLWTVTAGVSTSFYPAQLVFGNPSLVRAAAATPLVAVATFAAAYRFWTRALDAYQGVGN